MAEARTCVLLHMRALGEAVFALPLLHALRHDSPPWRTVSVIEPGVGKLLAASGLVDRVIPRQAGPTWDFSLLTRVRRERPRACLSLTRSGPNSVLAALSGASFRLALEGADWSRWLPTVPFPGLGVENYLAFLPALGVPRTVTSYCGLLQTTPEAEAEAEALLVEAGLTVGTPFLALVPTSTGKLGVKAYPEAYWREVVGRLAAEGHALVLVGTRADATLHQALLPGEAPAPVVSLAGRTSPLALAAVLRRAACAVGVDTGPLHVAAAVGTRCVVIFGPSDPAQTAPCGEGHVILSRGLDCQPCLTAPCPQEGRCLREIAPALVVEAARQVLSPSV